MKTVVLGGYGNFGARICRALAPSPGIDLIVAGRDLDKGNALARACGHGASAARIDIHDPQLTQALRALGAELVIHTAGPFQQQDYGTALATAAAGAHYIDLADGRRFVCDFPAALDDAFRRQQRRAITGASSVPAMSSAVVDHLTAGWRSIDAIEMCIAPAQTAPRGVATMSAVLSYCGAPIQVWQDGRWTTQLGWAAPVTVAYARLRPRLASLCDIPDLELFPAHYAGVRTVMFRAALETGISQRGMAALAGLRRLGLVRHPERFAGLLNRAADGLNFLGSALGGMVVRVHGVDAAGTPARRAWHIAADHDHGPEIPCMAAVLLARRLALGTLNAVGAVTSVGQLTLAEFEPEFAKWGMVTDLGE
ncbi:saccharopine dehydrogenase family protein [Massilia genomosp. 1]|uniref:Saccharopine dehydrogenase n=1 Tax=Massilia genomosp. 1 TaxID=2609280 RepID=A0ABX0MK21_9BURK|nr:saccharopine dehydrogenase [Massilia genomosp. 1]NHZ63143.1 saccharopine dehydrogenase [Massilia genomosp. 1]